MDELAGFIERGVGAGDAVEEEDELIEGDVPKLGERFSEDFKMKGVGLESAALAVGAGGISTVAGEEDADVHLVGFCFEPIEEALDAIPSAFAPKGL